jgi:3-hydroxybutyryl-CoA dehydrogenase
MEVKRVAVAGTGQMGPGIALTFALAGCRAVIVGRTDATARQGVAQALGSLEILRRNKLVEAASAEAARSLIEPSTDLDGAAAGCDLFVESIPEKLELKQEFFERLDRVAPAAVLCSNTSGISITQIAARCRKPERVLTTHFWNPPHLMPLVEVVMGQRSDLAIAQGVVEILRRCGKVPVLVRKDVPGQLGNRIQHAMLREAMHIVAEGIASAEDVDLAIKAGTGLRTPVYGLFEHHDLVGLDSVKLIQDYVVPNLSTVQGASPIHNEKVARGDLGAKTGRGFLDWPAGKAEKVKARRDAFLMEFLRLKKEGRFE